MFSFAIIGCIPSAETLWAFCIVDNEIVPLLFGAKKMEIKLLVIYSKLYICTRKVWHIFFANGGIAQLPARMKRFTVRTGISHLPSKQAVLK